MIDRPTKPETRLHRVLKHTNIEIPISDYITANTFPLQDNEKLNTYIELKYRLLSMYKNSMMDRPSSGRPHDDNTSGHREFGPEDIEQPDIYTGEFRVLRYDIAEPYVLIAINNTNSMIIVNSTRPDDEDNPLYETKISEVAIQNNDAIGFVLENNYLDDNINGVLLSWDDTEPSKGVIMEYVSDTLVRFVLDEEVKCSIVAQYYKDTNGNIIISDHGSPIKESKFTPTDVMEFRNMMLKDKEIYGNN